VTLDISDLTGWHFAMLRNFDPEVADIIVKFTDNSSDVSFRPRPPRCLIPGFDGASLSSDSKDALWDRFFMGAPRRQRRSVERYSIVKRA
jgi:hypothetical protein